MPIVRRIAVLSIVALLGFSVPAVAAPQGGPTSVLLTAPELGRASGLYYTNADYTVLLRQIESEKQTEKLQSPQIEGPHARGPEVHLSWLLHDIRVWRIDRIYPQAPGGPWIATTLVDRGDAFDGYITWHTPTNPSALLGVLAKHGLLDPRQPAKAPVSQPVPQTVPAATSTPIEGEPSAFTGWRWSLLGLLVGGLLVLLALRVRRSGPRWELIDS